MSERETSRRTDGDRSHVAYAGGESPSPPRGGGPAPADLAAPRLDPEVVPKAVRRQHSVEYKLRVLRDAAACSEPGQVGALLRREGLYSSHLWSWRRQQKAGTLVGRRGGRKRKPVDSLDEKIRQLERDKAQLERAKARLEQKLERAETVIEFQKKLSEMLGIDLKEPEGGENT
jgi:transposase